MEEQQRKNHNCVGILAHVDAGKTTLSEAMLYVAGAIRRLGRVDHGNAFLDTFALERQRGITIFSKQAVLSLPERELTLLDTPGHVDFSAEMERSLSVMDCAVLVISGTDGVQSHTMTVWKLLRRKRIPTFLFVNKMDLPNGGKEALLTELRRDLGDGIFEAEGDLEPAAETSETLLDEYLETGTLSEETVRKAVAAAQIFPCWFGAALKLEGVEPFLRGLERLAPTAPDSGVFAARVFKISRDEQGVRLTHLKITGGTLRTRETLSGPGWEEKVTGLRVYSGARFRAAEQAEAGQVVAVTGLSRTYPGQGLGAEAADAAATLEPVLSYRVFLPQGLAPQTALGRFRELEEEEPTLQTVWNERLQELSVRLMGKVQLEILQELLRQRWGMEVSFGPGSILYRETIAAPVEGVGHYEPLRHYAEVHLLIEPAQRGSGITLASAVSEDDLARNWQRLIFTHLAEKQHLGVLTGSPLTDVTITLTAGRAHLKHTEGGDFREATYRAVRQGLMKAQSILLEPWYDFILELPLANLGRALTDLERMNARLEPAETRDDTAVLRGSAPVAAIRDYPGELVAYTRGLGRFSCSTRGYEPCPRQAEIVAGIGYDPQADVDNTPDSVFCSHGAGHIVKWDQVEQYMHLPATLTEPDGEDGEPDPEAVRRYSRRVAGDKELMQIFERTYGPVKRRDLRPIRPGRPAAAPAPYRGRPQPQGPEYLLVDGYNVIHSWDSLRRMAQDSLELARSRLIDRLRNYQGYRQCPVILVFDAYKVKGGQGSVERYGDFSVVYTKEAETADMYIERVTARLGEKHRVRVVTSDGLEQIIILNHGCLRVPAAAFEKELDAVEKAIAKSLAELDAIPYG